MTKNRANKSAEHPPVGDERRSEPDIVELTSPDIVELASMESFPASDPPPWTLGSETHMGSTDATFDRQEPWGLDSEVDRRR